MAVKKMTAKSVMKVPKGHKMDEGMKHEMMKGDKKADKKEKKCKTCGK